MAQDCVHRLTLDHPVQYRVQVPGHLDPSWVDWLGELQVEFGCDEKGTSITSLTGRMDQAALIGLLRRLYAWGLPLISVTHLKEKSFIL